MSNIPLSSVFLENNELNYLKQSLESRRLSGDGPFTKKCEELMQSVFGARCVLLTTSCTTALEMAALLCDIQPGDEVILPSFTFPSTANAFLLRGARLIFVDVKPDTMNIDCEAVAQAITERTKVIVPVHYAGVGCDMNALGDLVTGTGIRIVEDAAQAVNASYKGQFLGTIGDIGTYSFHETKNFVAGEGGAIVVNDAALVDRAHVLREKGTNRKEFLRGAIDKYSWVDIGSSYLPADLLAALLYAQLETMQEITDRRKEIYNYYHRAFAELQMEAQLRLPQISAGCVSNYHAYFLRTRLSKQRDELIEYLKKHDIQAAYHFVPLHTSTMGQKLGNQGGTLPVTEMESEKLIRLPLSANMTTSDAAFVVEKVSDFFRMGSK